jgi:hypothetical protein
MSNQLRVIRPHTLSLVERPANKRFWYVVKKEKNVKNLNEVFPIPEEYQDTFENIENEEKAAKDVQEAIKDALEILSKWTDEMPSEARRAIGLLAGAVGYGESYGYPESETKSNDDALRKLAKFLLEEANMPEEQKQEKTLDDLVETLANHLDVESDEVRESLGNMIPDAGKSEDEEVSEAKIALAEKLGVDAEEIDKALASISSDSDDEDNDDNEEVEGDEDEEDSAEDGEDDEENEPESDREDELTSVDDLPEGLQVEIAEALANQVHTVVEEGPRE